MNKNPNDPQVFQSLPDLEKVQFINKMIEEYKDSPKIVKVLEELKSGIEE